METGQAHLRNSAGHLKGKAKQKKKQQHKNLEHLF
jgi:hypothetical protein